MEQDLSYELRKWRYAVYKLINNNPLIKCTEICDGDCIDCMTSASNTARGFHLKDNILDEIEGAKIDE